MQNACRIIYALCICALMAFLLAACNTGNNNENQNQHEVQPDPPAASEPSPPEPEPTDPLLEYVQQMTLEEKIGQLIIAGVNGYEPDASDTRMIEELHVGGFIFFERNIQDARQWASLIGALKEINAQQGNIPLFLGVDEEGGRVSRIPEPYQALPASGIIGKQKSPELSYQIGEQLAAQVRMFGINLNFAPVLDVASNPDNPVIGDRSLSADPDIVGLLGTQTMRGMQDQGIIPVVKHFPGHGDTALDSHLELPVVEHDRERLASMEWKPFQEAIDHNADAVMTAHILYPKLDPDLPATLSPILLTDILRETLGFQGVIITDDLTMKAIVDHYEIGEAAVQSLLAGSDVLLVCHGHDAVETVIHAVQQEVHSGALSEKRIDESVYRVLKLKTKYQLDDHAAAAILPAAEMNESIQQVLSQMDEL